MGRPKRHRHSKELVLAYGFAYASGWRGLGATYLCKSCYECLWFIDDSETNYPDEFRHNEKKRKKNKRWNPNRYQTFSEKRQLEREINEWFEVYEKNKGRQNLQT